MNIIVSPLHLTHTIVFLFDENISTRDKKMEYFLHVSIGVWH